MLALLRLDAQKVFHITAIRKKGRSWAHFDWAQTPRSRSGSGGAVAETVEAQVGFEPVQGPLIEATGAKRRRRLCNN
jgi:hypothetical protein